VNNNVTRDEIMSRIPMTDEDNFDPGAEPADEEILDTEAARREGAEFQKLRAERDDLFERLARTQAEFQNSRKRLEADMDQRVQYANTNLIKALLPVIDSFERALSVDPPASDAAGILKGMQIVHDQLMMVLGQHHVEEIAPEPGEPFDPSKHEALMQQADEQYDEPTVTRLLQKGYALHGRTLRPAQVAVSKTS
jgi:molecular chaperone GrpE